MNTVNLVDPLRFQVTVRHVAEAARLIDKSIIRVEQPDIEMDENYNDAVMDGGFVLLSSIIVMR